jgi:hypothetical protein
MTAFRLAICLAGTLALCALTGGTTALAESAARKAGEGQKDFLKIEMKEVFITGRTASGGGPKAVTPPPGGALEASKKIDMKPKFGRAAQQIDRHNSGIKKQ